MGFEIPDAQIPDHQNTGLLLLLFQYSNDKKLHDLFDDLNNGLVCKFQLKTRCHIRHHFGHQLKIQLSTTRQLSTI